MRQIHLDFYRVISDEIVSHIENKGFTSEFFITPGELSDDITRILLSHLRPDVEDRDED